jgi:hypothetical protein
MEEREIKASTSDAVMHTTIDAKMESKTRSNVVYKNQKSKSFIYNIIIKSPCYDLNRKLKFKENLLFFRI